MTDTQQTPTPSHDQRSRATGQGSDGEPPHEFDLVVIGAGPVGENVAQYATQDSGLTAVLVERELVGGECSYFACMPSKALLRPVEVAETTRHLPGVSEARVDAEALLARRDDWVSHYDDAGQAEWVRRAGIDLVRGDARLAGERRVVVETAEGEVVLQARRAVVIATGSVPVVPEPYADLQPWGSRDATAVREVPHRLLVIGGGVVACEAATWLAALGSQVTMLVRGERLLASFEPEASELVLRSLQESGVQVRLTAEVTEAHREGARAAGLGVLHGGEVSLTTAAGESFIAEEILVAAGRRPALSGIGLERLGLDPKDPSSLPEWLHLVGDASGEAALTHWGKYRARVLGERLAAQASGAEVPEEPARVPVPQVVFTEPQVAQVGLTEQQARTQGWSVEVATVDWNGAAGASLLRDDASGVAKLVACAESGQVLGATFVGPGAGELLHAATIAIVSQTPVRLLRHAVPAYPTASELWLRLLESLPSLW